MGNGSNASRRASANAKAAIAAVVAAATLVLGISDQAVGSGKADSSLKTYLSSQIGRAGSKSGAWVYNATERKTIFSRKSRAKRIPASNQKLVTSAAILENLGPDHRISTEVLATGEMAGSTLDGSLYLRGTGDPSYADANFANAFHRGIGTSPRELAKRVRRAGVTRVRGRVYGDESAFDGRRGVAGTGFASSVYLPPLSALGLNSGYTSMSLGSQQSNPALFAASHLRSALSRAGVRVDRDPRAGKTPADARVVASVSSHTAGDLLKPTNKNSDNYFAEMLLKHLGLVAGGVGTTASGAAVAERSARAGGATRIRVVDGSGLSRGNAVAPQSLGKVLVTASRTGNYEHLRGSLSVAGVDGTLASRMRGTAAQGRVRAKTGTLSGVSALSGYAQSRGGDLIVFSILMNGVNVYGARAIQDRMAAAIAAYTG